MLHDADITRQALVKLLKITIFIVQHKWSHTTTYEDFVRFVGENLEEQVLKEYLNTCQHHKNDSYLSTTQQFVEEAGSYIKEMTLNMMKGSDDFTLLLDESTDCNAHSQLALIACIVIDCGIQKKKFGFNQTSQMLLGPDLTTRPF